MALIPLLALEIRTEHDVVLARQRARQIAEGLGLDHQNQIKLGTAVSEIVRNAFRYAGGGRTTYALDDQTPSSLVIEVTDHGPGIADLAAVLEGRYRSTTGLGLGLIGVRRLMEVCDIVSTPGEGTRVTMRKYIPALVGHRQLMAVAGQLAETFLRDQRNDPVAEVQYQNQELLRTLSELRARQDELEQLNRELEDTNRGVVALHAELDVRADHLRRASRTKSRFLSNMSHEFRTPLNSIQALANLLLDHTDGELSPEQRRQVTFIRRSCEQLAELVDDLLDLAKVEAGKVAVKTRDFTVAELFGALKGVLRPLLPAHGAVTLEFEAPRESVVVHSDEGKVSQIMRNLIANALKFTERGEVRVAARLLPAGRIAIAVNDSGIGIAEENLEHIFDEFAQVEGGRRATGPKGTGLGLPLSRRLAQLLGGTVRAESSMGSGSVFTLEIPLTYEGSGEFPLIATTDEAAAESTTAPTVLIIDDDEVARYLLRGILPPGLKVHEAKGGVEGLAAIRRLRPNVVFLDLSMTDISGFEVLDRVTGDPDIAGLKIIIYSAQHIDDQDRKRLGKAVAIVSKRTDSRDEAIAEITKALRMTGIAVAERGRA
ncbi:MAG: ATP-binding protein [Planctomycetes bacterium]|nr:ATP-binding protein [Planctomycetota bacterium]